MKFPVKKNTSKSFRFTGNIKLIFYDFIKFSICVAKSKIIREICVQKKHLIKFPL